VLSLTPVNLPVFAMDMISRITQLGAGSIRTVGELDMSEDIIVLGGLATVFCWTYIVLPLIYAYNLYG
jgi:hypothetical protein